MRARPDVRDDRPRRRRDRLPVDRHPLAPRARRDLDVRAGRPSVDVHANPHVARHARHPVEVAPPRPDPRPVVAPHLGLRDLDPPHFDVRN